MRFKKESILFRILFNIITAIFTALLIMCISYNFYSLFHPIDHSLKHDEAEHLHVAYLISLGERPFVDFIENHPMLFNHFLRWIKYQFNLKTTIDWAQAARWTILFHLLLFLTIGGLWITSIIKNRPRGIVWIAFLLMAVALIDFNEPIFDHIRQIRPDFFCYAYTLLGCYLAYLSLQSEISRGKLKRTLLSVIGGFFLGFGNAILPKGSPIISGIILTVITAGLINPDSILKKIKSKKILIPLAIFLIASVSSFTIGLKLDCFLSNISTSTWISGVIHINSQKHIVYSTSEDNPITALLSAFSMNMALSIIFFLWITWEVMQLKKSFTDGNGKSYILLMGIFTILSNLLIAPFSNGVTWAYNYIPAFFAIAVILLILILKIYSVILQNSWKTFSHSKTIAISTLAILLSLELSYLSLEIRINYNSRKTERRLANLLSFDDYPIDSLYPKEFTYFAYYPHYQPVQSRHWGFYFMLADNTHFWRDYHKFGLGPDPQQEFITDFNGNPPDAIVFKHPHEIIRYIANLRACHGIDAHWLIDTINQYYTPIETKMVWMYVRNDRVGYMISKGWKIKSEFSG